MTWAHHAVLSAFGFALGASVGSFLNVCAWRLPRGESVVRPASRCPGCGGAIAARDNVPLLGWLLLRGRCRACSWPIPARYPLAEAATGLLFAAVFLGDLAFDPLDLFDRGPLGVLLRLAYHLVLVSLLVTVAMIACDARREGRAAFRRGEGAAAALVVVSALTFALASDPLGACLNALLLSVFLLGATPTADRPNMSVIDL